MRDPWDNIVSTSGVLLTLGSATNTYQLKDDRVTYAYAFPTPNLPNVFPGSPSSSPVTVKSSTKPTLRPVAKATLSPSMTKAPTTVPTVKVTSKPVAKVTLKPTVKASPKPVAKATLKPTVKSSSKTAPSPTAATNVFVNEVADKGDNSVCGGTPGLAGRDWVELYNSASTPVDISGWKLHDDHGPDYIQAYIFPVGTVLAPTSYTIFCQADTFIFGIGGYVICLSTYSMW